MTFNFETLSLELNLLFFVGAAAVISYAGVQLAGLADRLADRTGLGEAVTGTVFLGLTTALPGLTASITAALDGHPALAISNAIGGIALQTTFLAVADIAYRQANLEHAAASVANMLQTTILVLLLSLTLLGFAGPEVTVGHVHPVTPLLFLAAGFGTYLVYRGSEKPMWLPHRTRETVEDVPDRSAQRENLPKLLISFFIAALLTMIAGAVAAKTTVVIAPRIGLSETLAGAVLSGLATSLPELVTTVAAVRPGALTLAVSDIAGGNFFDILFVFAADVVYVQGSIYHAEGVGMREIFLIGTTILLNGILLLGLLYRQRSGPANIGFESLLMLIVYVTSLGVLFFAT